MFGADLPAPLFRLKALIWVQSAVGVLIGFSVLAILLSNRNEQFALGLLFCGVLWMLGFAPLRRRAAQIGAGDRAAPTGLPAWVPGFLAYVGFVSVFVGGLFVLAALPAVFMIALRWLVSNALDIPVHRRTWGRILAMLALGIAWNVVVFFAIVSNLGD